MAARSRKTIQRVFTALGLVGLAIVVFLDRHDLISFWRLSEHLHWYVIAAVVVVQLGSYWLNALYYLSILRVFSYDTGPLRLFEGALAANFVNYVLPSAGLAGAGFLSQVLAPQVPRGVSVLVQLMRYALSALAVLIMMPVGIALLFIFNPGKGGAIVDVTIASAIAITLAAVVLVALIQNESLARRVLERLIGMVGKLINKARKESVWQFVDQFYGAYHSMVSHLRQMWLPFAWSILYIIVEIGTLYMAFLAFGEVMNLGVVVMAYLFANIASVFGGVLFSTGVFELGMAGTLIALGMRFALAVSVTTVYRVTNLIIGLPPGFFYYRKYLAPRNEGESSGASPP